VDLTWTGSQFLDPREHAADILAGIGQVDFTTKDDTWSRGVAASAVSYYGLSPGSVRVAAGSTQLIEALLRGLYRGLVVDVVPNFHLTATICRQEAWNYRPVQVREPGELLPALESFLERDDVVVSLSSPRNPLAYQFDLADIATVCRRLKGTLILDEVYADFASDSALRLLAEHRNLFVVRTFSKAWGLANLRIGFVASAALAHSPSGAPQLRLIPNSVAGVAQRAAIHLLAHPETVQRSIDQARTCRDRMIAELSTVPGLRVWPSAANYLCIETPIAARVAETLAEAGYLVRLLHDLRDYPPSWPAGIRVSVPPPPHLDAVVSSTRASHQGLDVHLQARR